MINMKGTTGQLRMPEQLRSLLAGVVMAALAGSALALPPEHEVQRLMLAIEDAVDAERWTEAAEYLNRLQALDVSRPADYFFYRGRVMAQSGHFNEARSALENYIAGTGADGEHYAEALKLITHIERTRSEQVSKNGGNSEPVAEIRPAREEQSTERLRTVYQAGTDREALVKHLNHQLEQAGWRREARLIREGEPADVEYQVSVDTGEIQVRESRAEPDGRRRLIAHAFRVYGVSSSVHWDCETSTSSCWIYDPRDGSRFLQLADDRDHAASVAASLGRLIRHLQQPAGNH